MRIICYAGNETLPELKSLALKRWPDAALMPRNVAYYKGEIEDCDGVAVHQSVSEEVTARITENYSGAGVVCEVLAAEKPKNRKTEQEK
ncbi:MAG TPA: hypothetical protein VNQ79_15855 [Blastocatellia bacterium]|nr:hypothetical protein [Blastocatellia bacterium]